jgi:hypothetical protein
MTPPLGPSILPAGLALLLALLPAGADGAEPETTVEMPSVAPSPSRGPKTTQPAQPDGSWSVLPLFGGAISTLRGGFGSLGLGVGQVHGDSWYGATATVELGRGGTAALLGAGWIGAEGLAALFARVAFLRTGEKARGVAAEQDYVGVEVKGMLLLANLTAGVYRRVGGRPDAPEWLGTVGAGLWF